MEGSFGKLRNLDAYPKINEDFYGRTLSGGIITIAPPSSCSSSSSSNSMDEEFSVDVDLWSDDDRANESMPVGSNAAVVGGCTSGRRKRKLTSPIYQFFHINEATQRCKCIKCGMEYPFGGKVGIKNLKRHVESCRKNRDTGQMILSQFQGSISMHSSNFDLEKFRELVTYAIIKHDLPFQFVEYEGIRSLFAYICEDVKLVSRNTVKADVLKLYKKEKEKLLFWLHAIPSTISLTLDMWTSITTDRYLCLTAHFIDEDWVLQKKVLNFRFVPPHNGISLCETIYGLLIDWGIEKYLYCMTLDNASVNDIFVDMLKIQLNLKNALYSNGQFFYVRCCAYILNLIVQEGLKEIDEGIFKVRESIKYVRGSQVRKQKFLECVRQVSLESKKGLKQDVPTRWNSTFLMLESALVYRRAFFHLKLSDSNYKHCPSEEEWGKIEKISKLLNVFYDATLVFSGAKYPTSNLYFPHVFLIELTLRQEMQSVDAFMQKIAQQMYQEFEKYWSDHYLILAMAVILDPRYKFQFVEYCYKKLNGNGCTESMRIRDYMFALFNQYMVSSKTQIISTLSHGDMESGTSCETSDPYRKADAFKDFDIFESFDFMTATQKSQLELYLDEPRVDRKSNLDILNFWKANQFLYPQLSLMARDILSIPISTVAYESAFSIGGRVLDKFHSALKPDIAEALICTRDWVFGRRDVLEPELDEIVEDVMNSSSVNEAQ